MRNLALHLSAAQLPIRINAIAPSWTASGMVNGADVAALGGEVQTSDDAARSALFLMADAAAAPHGLLVQSHAGRYRDVERAFVAAAGEVYPEGLRGEGGGCRGDAGGFEGEGGGGEVVRGGEGRGFAGCRRLVAGLI